MSAKSHAPPVSIDEQLKFNHRLSAIDSTTEKEATGAETVTGAKHKLKAADKEASINSRKESTQQSSAAQAKEDAKEKPTKKQKVQKDADGNKLKRPMSAYMLYNNYRRPVIRQEHQGKPTECQCSCNPSFRISSD